MYWKGRRAEVGWAGGWRGLARGASWWCIVISQFSRSVVSDSLRSPGLQHARPPCPSPTPGACSNSCPLSRWCHPTISSSVCPLLLFLSICSSIKVFPNESALCISIRDSASVSVLPVLIQGWFLLVLTGLISLQSKGLLGVFSSTTVQKHQFLSAQPSLWSNSHIHEWLLENYSFDGRDLCWQTEVSAF